MSPTSLTAGIPGKVDVFTARKQPKAQRPHPEWVHASPAPTAQLPSVNDNGALCLPAVVVAVAVAPSAVLLIFAMAP